jgi:hypothetical protein
MVPADSHRVPRAPRYLGATRKEDCIFRYGTVTLSGRPFQAVLLTLSYPFFRTRPISETPAFQPAPVRTNEPNEGSLSKTALILCGPATPGFPFESPGLGCSGFARHYYRNHCCFLFLQVLRWFTSLSSLSPAMYSRVSRTVPRPGFPHSDIPGS